MALLGDFENLSHWHLQYIVIWYLQLNTDKTGARQGLIGKTGEMPARSRHCNAEQLQICHWETGKAGEALKQSQENCLFLITAKPTSDRMVWECLFGVHSIRVGRVDFLVNEEDSGSFMQDWRMAPGNVILRLPLERQGKGASAVRAGQQVVNGAYAPLHR